MGALDARLLLREDGAVFPIDPLAGQKTGWFFDQRQNRGFVAAIARGGARVLDLYCYTGGFSVQAARSGAAEVVGIDRSEPALALRRRGRGAERASTTSAAFRRGEAFGEAARLDAEGERFDIVIADPPAFAKSRKEAAAALRGYRKLARLAAAVTARGGILFLASCSYNVGEAEFAEAVRRGLADAGRNGRIIRTAGAGPDHPVHPVAARDRLPQIGDTVSRLIAAARPAGAGKVTRNTVPAPVVETSARSPPCARANSRAIASPSPLPPGRAEPKNGRNRFSRAFGGRPGPSSAMSMVIVSCSRIANTCNRPAPASSALRARFSKTR